METHNGSDPTMEAHNVLNGLFGTEKLSPGKDSLALCLHTTGLQREGVEG